MTAIVTTPNIMKLENSMLLERCTSAQLSAAIKAARIAVQMAFRMDMADSMARA